MLLAGVGLYGLLTYTVVRRIPEIGIRMALGATDRQVIRMLLSSALGLVLLGLALASRWCGGLSGSGRLSSWAWQP